MWAYFWLVGWMRADFAWSATWALVPNRTAPSRGRGRRHACAELAAKTEDPPSKRVMERSAEQWNSLADSVEKYELTRK